jgi:hypothetical protein
MWQSSAVKTVNKELTAANSEKVIADLLKPITKRPP